MLNHRTISHPINFQDTYPQLVKSKIKISIEQKATDLPTLLMDGLYDFISGAYWQLFGVNLNMINCHTTFLTLELKKSTNIKAENSTFGEWKFTEVQEIIIKNCSNSIQKGSSKTLSFYNSSGLIQDTIIKDLYFSRNWISVQNHSYIHITNSKFVNNTVDLRSSYILIEVLQTSTLKMSHCIFNNNRFKASAYIPRIPTVDTDARSFVEVSHSTALVSNSTFGMNKGRCIFLGLSTAELNSCTFYNNSHTTVLLAKNTKASVLKFSVFWKYC